MSSELEKRYGFAAQLAALSDDQMVSRFNTEVGNRGWGQARMYFMSCLNAELHVRSIDTSCISSSDGLQLNRKVVKSGETIVPENNTQQ
ncbi:MAG: hypothetical protein AB8B91_25285 [Rubripirellula sp.]